MEGESITDTNNVNVDIFNHASNAQRENKNVIFTSEKLDKLDNQVDAVENLKINNAEYYSSNTLTASDSQGNITSNQETVTHTSNGNSEQKVLSYWTIPIVPPSANLGIHQCIAAIRLTLQTLLTPTAKEIVANMVSDGV